MMKYTMIFQLHFFVIPARPDSVESRVSLLDKKLQRLESFMSGELEEVRQELQGLRTDINEETT